MTTESTIFRLDTYIYASPRYHAFSNLETYILPNNYSNYDNTNRTYDKYFPCYVLTSSDIPTIQITDQENKISELKGDIVLQQKTHKKNGKRIGKKTNPDRPFNYGLEDRTVYYSEFSSPKLHPGWSILQTAVKTVDDVTTYTPYLLIRALGNNTSLENYFSTDVKDSDTSIEDYSIGTIIKNKKKYWKCIGTTKSLPTGTTDSNWEQINLPTNVFNADVYGVMGNNIKYMKQVTSKRKFNPIGDTTLITWNVSYFESR
jgi:hypothetical protein